MRQIIWVALMLVSLQPNLARAAEIRVLSPGFVYNAGLEDLAADFTKDTGVQVKIVRGWMTSIVAAAETKSPAADVVILPLELMGTLALRDGIIAGSYTPLGRVEIGLAVKAGAPRPDISTIEKLAAVLKGAKTVVYSDPASGSMQAQIIDRMLKRPEFAGVPTAISTSGEGGQALRRGEGDMALQLVCEIYPYQDIALVAPLPPELQAHIDGAAAVSARAPDPKTAAAFIQFIIRPEAKSVWKRKGLDRF